VMDGTAVGLGRMTGRQPAVDGWESHPCGRKSALFEGSETKRGAKRRLRDNQEIRSNKEFIFNDLEWRRGWDSFSTNPQPQRFRPDRTARSRQTSSGTLASMPQGSLALYCLPQTHCHTRHQGQPVPAARRPLWPRARSAASRFASALPLTAHPPASPTPCPTRRQHVYGFRPSIVNTPHGQFQPS
jgi:hypothetical protein